MTVRPIRYGGSVKRKNFSTGSETGSLPTTSQVTPGQARELFESIIKEERHHPHRVFFWTEWKLRKRTDLRTAAFGRIPGRTDHRYRFSLCLSGRGTSSLLCLKASERGKSCDEIVTWAEKNCVHVCHNVTVDDLNHLHRGGFDSKPLRSSAQW